MAEDSDRAFLFEDLFRKPVLVRFDGELRTSDAGLTLLAGIDRRLGLTATLAGSLDDPRDPSRVVHSFESLLRQRVYSIALGCPDTNDAAHLSRDPALLLACGRRADDPRGLAAQPTLSRFDHAVRGRALVAMQRQLEDFVVRRLRQRHPRPRRIFIDLDPSVDPTHGQQPFAYFNGHYDTWCYLPMLGFLSVEGEAEQHLFHARLRAGLAKEAKGTPALLRRIVANVRRSYGKARICVRLDAGFAYPQVLEVLDELRVEYMVAIGGNAVLSRAAERHLRAAASLTETFGRSTALFGDVVYRTRSWTRDRRVIFKAEVLRAAGKSDRRNDRYVITNLRGSAQAIWSLYCRRGDSENRIKELKNDLAIDRTSCTRFLANQMRVLTTAAAYVLFQELRGALRRTELRRAMVGTLRLRLLRIGATITESVRRVVVSMPSSHPWKDLWRRAAAEVAALA
jgi:hypothetical protein